MQKRDILILCIAIAIAVAVTVSVFSGSAIQTGAWGLCFRQTGAAPIGNAGRDQLAAYDAFYLGNPEEMVLYLTFDAGYENGCTSQILDILKAQNVKACFFLAGNYIEKNADLVRRMVSEGHIVGNHTQHHYDMSKLTEPEAFAAELTSLAETFRECTGEAVGKFYRPPQGLYSEENLKQAQALGYKTIFWSLAHVDWNNDAQPDRASAKNTILSRTHPGAIVLLHSTSQTNAAILNDLIESWRAGGYRFGTLEEL